jgi:hypothetical protein
MDVYLPPLARRIKHPEGLIEQRIDRMAGNPSLSLSRACSRATPTTLAATLVAAAEHQNNPPTTPFVLKVIVFEYKR